MQRHLNDNYFKYAYELGPNDVFDGFVVVDRFLFETENTHMLHERIGILRDALYLIAKTTKWEGDGNIYFSSIPHGSDNWPLHIVTVKQLNNGTTYLVSPIILPHLAECKVYPKFQD